MKLKLPKNLIILFSAFLLVFQPISTVFASTETSPLESGIVYNTTEKYMFLNPDTNEVLSSIQLGEKVIVSHQVELLDSASDNLLEIPAGESISIIDETEDYFIVEYTDQLGEEYEGHLSKENFSGFATSEVNTEKGIAEEQEETDTVQEEKTFETSEGNVSDANEQSGQSDKSEDIKDDYADKLEPAVQVNTKRALMTAQSQNQKTYFGVALVDPTTVYQETSTDSKELKKYKKGSILKYRSFSSNWYEATVYINGKKHTGYIHKNHVENATDNQKTLQGIGKNNPTRVYSSASTSSSQLKSYPQGSVLKYRTFTSEWYQATVYINGEKHTGYIHKNHVENVTDNQETLQGIGKNNPTHVYSRASTDSSRLKSYSQGSVLKYRTFTSDWYQATVYINGKRQTGYIHKNHVENRVDKQTTLRGIGKKNPTQVYERASRNSKVIRSYEIGHVLKYKTFTSKWYEATVYIKGKSQIGYIHVDDVEDVFTTQATKYGFAMEQPTQVYEKASRSSKVIRSYNKMHYLKYKTFTSGWLEATIYINGEPKIGYINVEDVLNVDSNNQITTRALTLQNPTNVYNKPGDDGSIIKSYPQWDVIKVRTYNKEWLEATVSVNGKYETGYFRASDLELINPNQKTLQGYSNASPANVYSKPDKNSEVLKTYGFGRTIKFKSFSKDYYEATVIINGSAKTGYFHKDEIALGKPPKITHRNTKYNYSFKQMVDAQMKYGKPKADGAGSIDASRGLVEFYSNPLNFPKGTPEYFQFLVLHESAGLDAKEINEKILNSSAGSLAGQAQAFINAGKKFGINEAYLIAHALHETGNGKSTLALGIPVDKNGNVTRNSKGEIAKTSKTAHYVYNMYGYGAYDDCPIDCGAKYAFDKGWFTVEDSIIGGAGQIVKYIQRGQNTLYKMKWNPENPGYPQYATHVQWATAQTTRLYNIYRTLTNYTILFDVPKFNNMVDYKNTFGIVTSNLNYREGPGTNHKSLGIIPNGTKIQLIGSSPNGWYKANYNGKTGWVSATYVNLIY